MSIEFIVVPLAAAGVAQVSKFFIRSNHSNWSWRAMIAYSGMPSSHAAMTISLASIIGLREGFNAAFAIAFIYALITIRDAVGLRQQIGRQGKVINSITKDLDEEALLSKGYPHLLERVGHTPAQLAVGALIGFLTAITSYFMFA